MTDEALAPIKIHISLFDTARIHYPEYCLQDKIPTGSDYYHDDDILAKAGIFPQSQERECPDH
jgi:hypothetical protein